MNRYSDEVRTIIKNGGFYFTNSKGETRWNSIVQKPGDNRLYRKRVETIIVKNKKEIFVKKKPNGEYFLPGGSVEKDVDNIVQAENECHEESHMSIMNIVPTGITYTEIKPAPLWASESNMPVVWDGYITEVYVAEYAGTYRGSIEDADEDPFIRSGRFYPAKECMRFFRKEHKDAFLNWMKEQNAQKYEDVTESYITNYFRNKKLLREIGYNPEITKGTVDKLIAMLKKEYSTLISKSSIKREMKKDDVDTYFHPVCEFTFSDGSSIALVLNFDEKSGTPGAAVRSDSYGDLIIIYPCFFKAKKEDQEYIILHEIGHIRLHHIEWKHSHHAFPFGYDDTNKYREKMVRKGKVMYPELYADLYAVLSGAKMYSILNTAIPQDMDDTYDYRLTNQELANRYVFVTSKYDKYKQYNEGVCIMSPYDIQMYAIDQIVSESGLSPKEKDIFKNMIVNFTIMHDIKESKNDIDKDDENYMETVKATYNDLNKSIITESSENTSEEFEKFREAVDDCIFHTVNRIDERYNVLKKYMSNSDNPSYFESAYQILNKWKMFSEKKYDDCPDDKFGIPETRSFPLNTKKRVQSACRLFAHAPSQYKKALAGRIKRAMDEYNIPMDFIGPKAEIRKYL